MRVTVDGQVIMDGDLGQWSTDPPELIKDQLRANARPAPWMRALMMTMADAAMGGQSISVDVKTRGDGWDFSVIERRTLIV
jgi:hypothetical protein